MAVAVEDSPSVVLDGADRIFYGGRLARPRVVPTSESLTVYVTVLRELDVRTHATLAESLRAIEGELAGRESELPDPRSRASLRALP